MYIGTPNGGAPIQSIQFASEKKPNFQAKGMKIKSKKKTKEKA